MPAEQVEHVPRRLAGVDPLQLGDPPVGVGVAQHAELTGIGRPGPARTGARFPTAGTGPRCGRDGRCARRAARGSCRRGARQIHDRPLVEVAERGAERLGQAEPEAARAHAQPAQHPALVVVEEVVAPLDRGQQRLLARQRGARPAGEQPEALAEIVGDPLRRELSATGRGQLDRQRDPVELLADVDDRLDLHGAQAQVRPSPAGTVEEQPDRVELVERLDIDDVVVAPATTATARATSPRRTVRAARDSSPARRGSGRRSRNDSITAAASATRCSQLSNTTSVGAPDNRSLAISIGRTRHRPRSPRSPRAASSRSPADHATGRGPPTTPRPETRRAGPHRPAPPASSCRRHRTRSASPAVPVRARRPTAASSADTTDQRCRLGRQVVAIRVERPQRRRPRPRDPGGSATTAAPGDRDPSGGALRHRRARHHQATRRQRSPPRSPTPGSAHRWPRRGSAPCE